MRRAATVSTLAALALMAAPGEAPAGGTTPADREALAGGYREFLDRGRTPARAASAAVELAAGWKQIELGGNAEVPKLAPGDRLVFTDRGRSVLLVRVGREPIARVGARLVGAHIDTPAPRLLTENLAPDKQDVVAAYGYGGLVLRHWVNRPLMAVGRVAIAGGREVEIELGGERDDFALYSTSYKDGELQVITSSGAVEEETLVEVLHRRYGIDARDLESAEIYLVPRQRAVAVGVDRALIGAHGQDDRLNSYAAVRALLAIEEVPRRTAMVWLVDREEEGSGSTGGARSRFLENAYAYLLRGNGAAATEAALGRALDASAALSADTPACLDPNWPEVHETAHAPLIGAGPALFAFTGYGGKQSGSQAHAELIAGVVASFERSRAPLQFGQLGRVDEGGAGTIAKYLGQRGIDVVDVGACVINMHSPLELASVEDLWSAYRGFGAWLGETRDETRSKTQNGKPRTGSR